MKSVMKTLTKRLLVGTIFLTSCMPNVYVPERSELERIKDIPYNIRTMKCTHKSVMYHNHLRDKGIKSRIAKLKKQLRWFPPQAAIPQENRDSSSLARDNHLEKLVLRHTLPTGLQLLNLSAPKRRLFPETC